MSNEFKDDPFSSPDEFVNYDRTQQTSGSGKIVLTVFGVLGIVCVLACCGGGVALMYSFGTIMSAEIEMELRDHPQIREHLGELESLSMDWTKSAAIEGDDVYVYDVSGTDGSGELTVESITNFDGNEEIVSASLRLSTGEVIEIEIE